MAGNRDFLIGEEFATAAGLEIIPDPTLIQCCGQTVLLRHGDTLCTDDEPYQAFRRQVREPGWQNTFLNQSVEQRLAFARQARETSEQHTELKSDEIMDVNTDAVRRDMAEHGVHTLIHGHTHRPAVHRFQLDSRDATRIVLGDWHDQAQIGVADKGEIRLDTIRLN